jgi:hypothetical protein
MSLSEVEQHCCELIYRRLADIAHRGMVTARCEVAASSTH